MPANWAMRTPMNHRVMRSLHTRDLRAELRKPRVHLGFEALDALAKLSQTAIVVGHSDRRIAGRCLIGTSFDERLVQFDNHGCHGMSAPDARCWTGSCRHCRAPAAALSPLASRSIFGVSATGGKGRDQQCVACAIDSDPRVARRRHTFVGAPERLRSFAGCDRRFQIASICSWCRRPSPSGTAPKMPRLSRVFEPRQRLTDLWSAPNLERLAQR